ncbi:T9SS type A sorting domain-containing protein [candidate division KSB1 bacterium]|nr:T9SS type A sorting domain-containing protein [candidate division KSB1 bacterium]
MSAFRRQLGFIFCLCLFSISNGLAFQSDSLKSTTNSADYLIITPASFVSALQPLIQHREGQGLKVMTIDVQQIYEEFLNTTCKSEAIREFVSYALEYWADPAPQYVLLAGDTEIIPSYKIPGRIENEDSLSIDGWFVINKHENDSKPDAAIGRFPVTEANQLETIISKIIYFEQNLLRNSYFRDFLFFADTQDAAYFEDAVEQMIETMEPYSFSYHRIDLREDSEFYGTRDDLIAAMNQGSLFFGFYGHANLTLWSHSQVFTAADVENLDANSRPFIFTGVTAIQNFDTPGNVGTLEKLLLHPEGGAIATVAPTGLSYLHIIAQFVNDLYGYIFENPESTIGESILEIKRNKIDESISPGHEFHQFSLLGDPALKFPADLVTSSDFDDETVTLPDRFLLLQNYPNPFNPSTTIEFTLAKSAYVDLSIFTVQGRKISTLVADHLSAGIYKMKWDAAGLPSGIYLTRLKAGNISKTRSMILLR